MQKMFQLINQVRKDEEGATMVEYAIMVTLVALVAGAAVYAIGSGVSTKFGSVNTCLTSTNGSSC
ncbi:MAG TPA: Flp family type IVb pilin [Xanthobacteraceae bacterium]|jgi:pilus assembly protein Flp/PilA|nr:Flp family type IVb pilin [Xanthobacteraceae bacterium]